MEMESSTLENPFPATLALLALRSHSLRQPLSKLTRIGASYTRERCVEVSSSKAPPPDFSISASPTTIGPLNYGAQGTSTITISPMNGFAGTVTLSPSSSMGLTAMLSSTSIMGGSGTSTLMVSASTAGTYNLNITGTSGALTHSVKITVYVGADFTLTPGQTSLNISQDSSSTDTLTLQSLKSAPT